MADKTSEWYPWCDMVAEKAEEPRDPFYCLLILRRQHFSVGAFRVSGDEVYRNFVEATENPNRKADELSV